MRGDAICQPRWKAVRQFIQYTVVAAALLTPLPAAAQIPLDIKVPLIEWDLPAIVDNQPGAIVVDTQGHDQNRLWFVTRAGAPQRAFRFEPSKSLMKGLARWTSWELSETGPAGPGTAPGFSGGLKKIRPSYDRRYLFVRTQNQLQRIDTQDCDYNDPQTCRRTVWLDQMPLVISVSDVAIDDLNNVYTATMPTDDPSSSYVQRLRPGSGAPGTVTVTRWQVGGGAGFCGQASSSAPCLSGIAVHPNNRNLIYYAEPGGIDPVTMFAVGNNIGELDVSTNPAKIRRWSLSALGPDVMEPRQLHVDRWGKVWVVTASGHVVSLDPYNNRLMKHQMPLANVADPYSLALDDDVVGYTNTDPASNRVGMVHPKGTPICVPPPTPVYVTPTCPTVTVLSERAPVKSGFVPPNRKIVHGQVTSKQDGTFVEAIIGGPDSFIVGDPRSGNDSAMPLGITANKAKAEGTFFYTVGQNGTTFAPGANAACPTGCGADRVGFVRLQLKEKVKRPRDDDDVDDGFDDGLNHNGPDGHHGHEHHRHDLNDGDDDGLADDNDSPTARENVTVNDDTRLQGGQSVSYPITASPTSLALIFVATSVNDPLAQLKVDIYNSLNMLVGTSAPTPGIGTATVLLPAAGNYTARVTNMGMLPTTHTPMSIVREPPLP